MATYCDLPFIVAVHDAEPRWEREIRIIVSALLPHVGTAYSCAVVPQPFAGGSANAFARSIAESSNEIVLHGYSHWNPSCRPWRAIGLLTGGLDEFAGCPGAEAEYRLRVGQDILENEFGSRAAVFVPPAWCFGSITQGLADKCGLSILAGFASIRCGDVSIPVRSTSWDCGRIAALGYLGEAMGWMLQRAKNAVPCVVLHPRDVTRGFLPRALDLVNRLLDSGFEPTTIKQLIDARMPH